MADNSPPPTTKELLVRTQHDASSHLLALPAKIRNIIFKLVLGNKKIMPNSLVPADTLIIADGRVHEGGDPPLLSLPFVCKQLYSETMLYVYALSTFIFLRCSYSTPSASTGREALAPTSPAPVFPRLKQIVVNKAFRGFEEMQSRAEWQNLTLEAWLKRREKGDVEVAFVDTKEELGEQSRRW